MAAASLISGGAHASPSALATFINSSSSSKQSSRNPTDSLHAPHLHNLALQVLHNLQYQHDWTDLQIHTHYDSWTRLPPPPSSSSTTETSTSSGSPSSPPNPHPSAAPNQLLFPRPLITGIPPQRIYIHPDEQIELLKKENEKKKRRSKATDNGGTDSGGNEGPDGDKAMRSEREWVLPTHLREKWSLKKFGEVFDAIKSADAHTLHDEDKAENGDGGGDAPPPQHQLARKNGSAQGNHKDKLATKEVDDKEILSKKERATKRILLATVSDDSTVVYYIVHDGIVKPRQN